jgi:hypothetical protein
MKGGEIMLTVIVICLIVGAIFLIAHAMGKFAPLWPAVMMLFIIELLRILPIGK